MGSIGEPSSPLVPIFLIKKDGTIQLGNPVQVALMEKYFTIDYKENKRVDEKEDYTIIYNFKENIKKRLISDYI